MPAIRDTTPTLQGTTQQCSFLDVERLRVVFCLTSMPVGGAEVLVAQLCTGLQNRGLLPEICCLKERGLLGDRLSAKVSVHSRLLAHKFDLRVLIRLRQLFARRKVHAVVTVGAGDKMFWGRLAARLAGVHVICAAIHSTGWPDRIELPNRWLTGITDRFIAVAERHRQYLINVEKFPPEKVVTIPNGVDTRRFHPYAAGPEYRLQVGIPVHAPTVIMVAALRPEKNHLLALRVFERVLDRVPDARLLIVGDGTERSRIEEVVRSRRLGAHVNLLGLRDDVAQLLAASDVAILTSQMEANPLSLLEAMACGTPVVAPDVGSISETVVDGHTGFLTLPGDEEAMARSIITLLQDTRLRRQLGVNARKHVEQNWSIERTVEGYANLLTQLYLQKSSEKRVA